MKSLKLYTYILFLLIFTCDLDARNHNVNGKYLVGGINFISVAFSSAASQHSPAFIATFPSSKTGPKHKKNQANKDYLFSSDDISVSNVYPNPANDYVQFDYALNNRDVQAYIVVHDVLGGNIGEFPLPAYDRQLKIPTSNINPGVYFYTLRLGNENVITKKMVIRR